MALVCTHVFCRAAQALQVTQESFKRPMASVDGGAKLPARRRRESSLTKRRPCRNSISVRGQPKKSQKGVRPRRAMASGRAGPGRESSQTLK